MIGQLIFLLLLLAAVVVFTRNIRKVIRNIRLGRPLDRSDRSADRWKVMTMVALGQSKMVTRPARGMWRQKRQR